MFSMLFTLSTNPPVTGPLRNRPVMRDFEFLFAVSLNEKLLNKQSSFEGHDAQVTSS